MVSSKVLTVSFLVVGIIAGYLGSYIPSQQALNEQFQKSLKLEENNMLLLNKIDELEKELQQSKDELMKLNSQLESSNKVQTQLQEELNKRNSEIEKFKRDIAAKDTLILSKDKEVLELNKKVDSLNITLDRVKRKLEKLDNDRELLIQLRVNPQPTREATRDYWLETKDIATKVNPNLARIVDRILARLDAYFNWIDELGDRPNIADYIIWLITAPPSAIEYSIEVNNFKDQALLSIIDDLTAAIQALG
ncbi:MAG: hypothetical protein QXX95_07020 [Nitrososphaerales archaeon]